MFSYNMELVDEILRRTIAACFDKAFSQAQTEAPCAASDDEDSSLQIKVRQSFRTYVFLATGSQTDGRVLPRLWRYRCRVSGSGSSS